MRTIIIAESNVRFERNSDSSNSLRSLLHYIYSPTLYRLACFVDLLDQSTGP